MDTIPVKTLPVPTVKLIIKDILIGDSAVAELKLTQEELKLSTETILDNRKIIDELKFKNAISDEVIKFEKEKYQVLEKYSNLLQENLKKEKTTNKWIKIGSGSIIVLLITGLIVK